MLMFFFIWRAHSSTTLLLYAEKKIIQFSSLSQHREHIVYLCSSILTVFIVYMPRKPCDIFLRHTRTRQGFFYCEQVFVLLGNHSKQNRPG